MGFRHAVDAHIDRVDRNVLAVVVAGVADPGAAVSARGYKFEALSPQTGKEHPSNVAPQNPTDAQWSRNGRVTILEYENIKIT